MKNIVSLPDTKLIFNELIENPEKMFDLLRIDIRSCCEQVVSDLLKIELTNYLGREKYKRISGKNSQPLSKSLSENNISTGETLPEPFTSFPEKINYRNGYYFRSYTTKGLGNLKIENGMRVEKLRKGKSILKLLQNVRISMNYIHAGFFVS